MSHRYTRIALISLALALGACSSVEAPEPVGIGSGINDLQRSPCACNLIPMHVPAALRATPTAAS